MRIYSYESMLRENGTVYLTESKPFIIDGRHTYGLSKDIVSFINDKIKIQYAADEYAYCLCFDTKLHLIGLFEISHGTNNYSPVSPREVFQKALMIGATRILITHNHPGGDVTPSKEDVEITKRLIEAGKLLNVFVIDHIIVAHDMHMSMHEEKYCVFEVT